MSAISFVVEVIYDIARRMIVCHTFTGTDFGVCSDSAARTADTARDGFLVTRTKPDSQDDGRV